MQLNSQVPVTALKMASTGFEKCNLIASAMGLQSLRSA